METSQQKMVTDVFEQTLETCTNVFKTGLKMQGEAAKWWMDVLGEAGPVQDWPKRVQTMAAEVIPLTQKNAEEGLRFVNQTYHNNLDLLKNLLDAAQPCPQAEIREKLQSLWEASLGAWRLNTQALVQANAKALDCWSEFMHKGFGQIKPAEGKPAGKQGTPAT